MADASTSTSTAQQQQQPAGPPQVGYVTVQPQAVTLTTVLPGRLAAMATEPRGAVLVATTTAAWRHDP